MCTKKLDLFFVTFVLGLSSLLFVNWGNKFTCAGAPSSVLPPRAAHTTKPPAATLCRATALRSCVASRLQSRRPSYSPVVVTEK